MVQLLDASTGSPWTHHLSYTASKAALEVCTKSMARALAPEVLVYGVAPGIAIFPDVYDQALRARLTERVPLGRAGRPEDVACVVRSLLEAGDYVTGEVVRVDGGRYLG